MENDVGPSNGKSLSNDQFFDRSKVRILLCDNDMKSSEEIFTLLCKCSYQVTSVKTARQVIDALNAKGPNIDIILSEVDLPMKKGLKLLKYIMRDKGLQRVPMIMMSTQDEVSLVVKCLRLGAADYLVKPLRTNELLNLWTHMWRWRRMLGLTEKNIVTCDFNLAVSDLSDGNTNSTALFSDDTDDRSRRSINPEVSMTVRLEDESEKGTCESIPIQSFDCRTGMPGISDRRTGQMVLFPKKNEIKIGECSAFFTYVKTNASKNNYQAVTSVDENTIEKNNGQTVVVVDIESDAAEPSRVEHKSAAWPGRVNNGDLRYENGNAWEMKLQGEDLPNSSSALDSTSMERPHTPVSVEFMPNDESSSQVHMKPRNGTHFDVSGLVAANPPYPFYVPGMMNQVMLPSPHVYQRDPQGHGASPMIPHYSHLPHCPSHVPGMTPYAYYPMGMCMPHGQMPINQQQPSFGNSSSAETKLGKVDRREAALIKFRQKRKERCFDKKIRYVNRKRLAERRPRVRGQFVKKVNGITVDLNGDPSPGDLDEEDEDDDDPTSRDSSPEDDA